MGFNKPAYCCHLTTFYLHVERTGGGKGGNTAPIPVQRLPPLRPLRGVPGLSSISTPVCNPLVGDENHDAPVLSFTSPTVPVKTQPFPGHHRQSTAVEEGAATRPHASCSSLEQIRCVERPHMDIFQFRQLNQLKFDHRVFSD